MISTHICHALISCLPQAPIILPCGVLCICQWTPPPSRGLTTTNTQQLLAACEYQYLCFHLMAGSTLACRIAKVSPPQHVIGGHTYKKLTHTHTCNRDALLRSTHTHKYTSFVHTTSEECACCIDFTFWLAHVDCVCERMCGILHVSTWLSSLVACYLARFTPHASPFSCAYATFRINKLLLFLFLVLANICHTHTQGEMCTIIRFHRLQHRWMMLIEKSTLQTSFGLNWCTHTHPLKHKYHNLPFNYGHMHFIKENCLELIITVRR